MRLAVSVALAFLATACQEMRDPLLKKAEDAVRSKLKDPASAQFSEVVKCDHPGLVQGYVNGKNSFGAYAGNELFFYDNGVVFMQREWMVVPPDRGSQYFLHLISSCYKSTSDTDLGNFMNLDDVDIDGRPH